MKSDGELAIGSLKEAVKRTSDVEIVIEGAFAYEPASHGEVELAVQQTK